MKFKEYKFLIYSDLYRLIEQVNIRTLVSYIIYNDTFRYIFLMRTCQYLVNMSIYKISSGIEVFTSIYKNVLQSYDIQVGN